MSLNPAVIWRSDRGQAQLAEAAIENSSAPFIEPKGTCSETGGAMNKSPKTGRGRRQY
jgi:hypothetical protein